MEIADTNDLAIHHVDISRLVDSGTVTGWLSGKIRGELPFPHLSGSDGLLLGQTDVFEANDVYYTPEYGAVINSRDEVYATTAAEAKFLTPDYSLIPRPNSSTKTIDEAGIFMAWGGNTNYGHYLIDCLSGIVALQRANIGYPLVSPSLQPWHRELLSLLGKEVTEIPEPVVACRKAAWSSCMNHYLHAPNDTLLHVRDIILSNTASQRGSDKIYVSRSKIEDKRRMVNELELEKRLVAEGFEVFHPQEHSIKHQISVFHRAKVVVGAAGAQMANAIFMKPGTVAIEICPDNYSGVWIRNLCHLANVQWCCHYFPSPILELPHSPWLFSYRIDVDQFSRFLNNCVPMGRIQKIKRALAYLTK
ncbi:glycosyltransferase 61 family protein [Phyllobacterium sp. LjRoot231]|uniref:glycosyltransferase family 61 protein n=1 Tax=Phyllobacterium sp. LjRoot231 TaxID=3342289 RepID=UPI003ECC4A1F